jgi:DNA-binding response OmpR family regulator
LDQADGLDLGADGHLVKPFAFVVLVPHSRRCCAADTRR